MFKLIGFLLPPVVYICIFIIGTGLIFLLKKKDTYYVWYNDKLLASFESLNGIKIYRDCGASPSVRADKEYKYKRLYLKREKCENV